MHNKSLGVQECEHLIQSKNRCSIIDDERGLSGVVVAILLILVAVLAIVLIWGFLSGWLQELWEQITSQADTIS
jgi:Flp pilus assembly pilin Flp